MNLLKMKTRTKFATVLFLMLASTTISAQYDAEKKTAKAQTVELDAVIISENPTLALKGSQKLAAEKLFFERGIALTDLRKSETDEEKLKSGQNAIYLKFYDLIYRNSISEEQRMAWHDGWKKIVDKRLQEKK
jgi:hypothetical protein